MTMKNSISANLYTTQWPLLRLIFVIICIATMISTCVVAAEGTAAEDSAARFETIAKPFLKMFCIDCHGADQPEGDVNLDQFDTAFSGKNDDLWLRVLEQVDVQAMPPSDADQPSVETRHQFSQWALRAAADAGYDTLHARQYPAKGNYVPHELLFGSEARRVPASSPPRLWRLNPKAYDAQITDGLMSKTAYGFDDGLRKRYPLIEPLTLTTSHGLKDYAFRYSVAAPEIEQMATNARTVLLVLFDKKVGRNDPPGRAYHFKPRKNQTHPLRDDIEAAVKYVFKQIRYRDCSDEELARYADFAQRRIEKLGPRQGTIAGLVPIVMHPEAYFRVELGSGEPDQYGRRMLSPLELARAIAFAIDDAPPDEPLMAAVAKGRLATRKDVDREVDRMLAEAFDLIDDRGRTRKPGKTLRFFREYFDYTHCENVFKDNKEKQRLKVSRHNPEELIHSCDMVVTYVLHHDRQVLQNLLTMPLVQWVFGAKFDLKKAPAHSSDDWHGAGGIPLPYPRPQRGRIPRGILMHRAWLVAHSDNFDNHVIRRGHWIRERLLGGQIPDTPITVDAQLPDEPETTLRHRMRVTREDYCWRCHQRMDPLGFVFEDFNHFGYSRTHEWGQEVDTKGEVIASGDESLDGPVGDAEELLLRLAESERVHQVFVRHAFRFWLGRNETPDDAAVLQDAYEAYTTNNGSMRALIKSLLTSDAFLFRKPNFRNLP